ncbi:M56 family metallopeptidase [uncultured Chitinophaga sp.]|uniref:M56 family metallopeptidase n=1 Tax=uncultured Chitinophaga sp. TaxID=339340 RepID=UPI0025D27DDA|nr:M56 family metallopeptidase [uncultured Chitinophaga sp.]
MHLLEQWLQNSTVTAIGWTLLHSLWQGAIAAAATGIIILRTRRSSALLRYNLISGVAVVFLLGSLFTLFIQLTAASSTTGSTNAAAAAVCPPEPGMGGTLSILFNQYAGWMVMAWGTIFFFRICGMAGSLAYIRRLRSKEASLPSNEWRNRFYDIKHDMGIKKVVRLMESRLVNVPLTVGILKPIVLMPLGLLGNLPVAELETILVHELAHIRRNDYLVNLIQQVTVTIFFFNPALLWISALLKEEREACCDEIVIQHTQRKETYMQALVSFQEFTLTQNKYAMTLKNQQGALFSRIKRMLTSENEQLGSTGKLMLLAGAITITALCFLSATPVAIAGKCAAQPVQDTAPVKKIVIIDTVISPSKADRKSFKAKEAREARPTKVHRVEKVIIDTVWTKQNTTTWKKQKPTTWKKHEKFSRDSLQHYKSQQTQHISIKHNVNASPKVHREQHKIKNVNVDLKTNVNVNTKANLHTNIEISRKKMQLQKKLMSTAAKFKQDERRITLNERQLKLKSRLVDLDARQNKVNQKEKKLMLEKAKKPLESRGTTPQSRKANKPLPTTDPLPEIESMP